MRLLRNPLFQIMVFLRLPLVPETTGTNYAPPYSIARSGTIPHSSAIMITGGFQAGIPGKLEYSAGTDCWTQPFSYSWPTAPTPQDQTASAFAAAKPVPLVGPPHAISPSMGVTCSP